jgi:hypothetical protein
MGSLQGGNLFRGLGRCIGCVRGFFTGVRTHYGKLAEADDGKKENIDEGWKKRRFLLAMASMLFDRRFFGVTIKYSHEYTATPPASGSL